MSGAILKPTKIERLPYALETIISYTRYLEAVVGVPVMAHVLGSRARPAGRGVVELITQLVMGEP